MTEPEDDREVSSHPLPISGLLHRTAPMDEHDGRTPPGGALDPTPLDIYVGSQITKRREGLDIGLASLARRLAVSLRVMSAYETGTIRVGGDRLLEIATQLNCAPSFFFQNHGSLHDPRTSRLHEDQRTEILEKHLVVLDSLMISNLLKNMRNSTARLRVIDYAIQVSKDLNVDETANHARPNADPELSPRDARGRDRDGRA